MGPLPGDEWGYTATFDRENGGGFLTDHFPCATKAIWYFEGIYAYSPHIPGEFSVYILSLTSYAFKTFLKVLSTHLMFPQLRLNNEQRAFSFMHSRGTISGFTSPWINWNCSINGTPEYME